ncbi:MAG: aminotransferase class IV [Planctomycetaceae bacterium]
MSEPLAWINGTLQPFSQMGLPVWDLGVVAGAAVTEMARTYLHRPFRLEQHIGRLTSSLTALGFPQRWTADDLHKAAESIVQNNVRQISEQQDLGIVLFSTAGSNPTYLAGVGDRTTTVIHTFVLPFQLWRSGLQRGVRLRIPEIRQIPDDCFPVEHKVRNRLHWWLADQQAAKLEPGSKALLLDYAGFITETSTSCFYLVHEGRISTPDRGVLNSLSSEIVEELASVLQIPFSRRQISVDELSTADEAFLSSTPVGLLPVSHIDGRSFQFSHPNSVFKRLIEKWETLTGLNPAQQILDAER